MQEPLVTIIVPVYKTEHYLRKCIESIVYQSYIKLEILIINDNSPDNSEEIIRNYQVTDNRIRIIRNEINLGLGATRNIGIENARGELVMFIDSDDTIEENTIKDCVVLKEKYKTDLIEFGFQLVQKREKRVSSEAKRNIRVRNYNIDLKDKRFKKIERAIDHIACNKIYFLKIIQDNNIRFKSRYYEDTPFTREYLFCCKAVTVTNQKYYNYFVHSGSITQSRYSISKIEGLLNSENIIFNLLRQHDLTNQLSRRYINLFRKDIVSIFQNSDELLFANFVSIIGDSKFINADIYESLKYDRIFLKFTSKHKILFKPYAWIFSKMNYLNKKMTSMLLK